MKKSEVVKQLIQAEEFTTNAAVKEILANTLKFINKK